MFDIERLQERLNQALMNLNHYKVEIDQKPGDPLVNLQYERYREEVDQYSAELQSLQSIRGKEIVELHLEGVIAHKGSLPLLALSELTSSFHQALTEIILQLEVGEKRNDKRKQEINQQLDLRLAKIGVGSTRLFITGQTQPDLFGRSMLQEGLKSAFDLLEAQNGEELLERASVCGHRGVSRLNTFLKKASTFNLSCDIAWNTPNSNKKTWEGDKDRIRKLTQSLSKIHPGKVEVFDLVGEIVTVSLKGKGYVELSVPERGIMKLFLIDKAQSLVRQIHVGTKCKCIIESHELVNSATQQSKANYRLSQINTLS